MKAKLCVLAVMFLAVCLVGCKGLDPNLTGGSLFDVCNDLEGYVEADAQYKPTGEPGEDAKRAVRKKAALLNQDLLKKTWIRAGYEPKGGGN